jgi:hypothetical protein
MNSQTKRKKSMMTRRAGGRATEGWFQWRTVAPAPEALPPARSEVARRAGGRATAGLERAVPPTLELPALPSPLEPVDGSEVSNWSI